MKKLRAKIRGIALSASHTLSTVSEVLGALEFPSFQRKICFRGLTRQFSCEAILHVKPPPKILNAEKVTLVTLAHFARVFHSSRD